MQDLSWVKEEVRGYPAADLPEARERKLVGVDVAALIDVVSGDRDDENEGQRGQQPGRDGSAGCCQRPVRIGQTSNLLRRLHEYEVNYWWFREPTASSFAYVVVRDKKTRERIESIMIKFVGNHAIFNTHHRLRNRDVEVSPHEGDGSPS